MATMTLQAFESWAAKEARKRLELPAGWWGDWRHVYAPNGIRVTFSSRAWVVRDAEGVIVSKHDSRAYAIKKASKL